MSYYRTCPNCGAALDPGEKCECVQQERDRQAFLTAIQDPETRAAVVDILEKAGLLDNGGKEDARKKQN